MAEVFLARDRVLEREVAVKTLHPGLAQDPRFLERFRREARAAASLAHPRVVQVFDWGEESGQPYIVMEYVPGPSLRQVLHARGRLTVEETLHVAVGVLDALEAAHQAGLVHRDIKPENILLAKGGPKVADFGLVRALAEAPLSGAHLFGTPQYLSPEQVRGFPAEAPSDLYSLGIVLYECLTGEAPFKGENPVAVALDRLSRTIPPPSALVPKVPPGVDSLVLALTRARAEDRPSTSEALAVARALLRGEDPSLQVAPGEETRAAPHAAATEAIQVGAAEKTLALPMNRARKGRFTLGFLALAALTGLGVLLGRQAAAWLKPVPVPAVLGLEYPKAVASLKERGFRAEVAGQIYSSEYSEGTVARQEPPPQALLRRGSTVRLWTSLGKPKRKVPSVLGLDVDEARRTLEEAGFRLGEITQVYDDRVPSGRVVEQNPKAETNLEVGSSVDIAVSKGPRPVAVPSVVGKTLDEAEAALAEAGLKAQVTQEYSDTVPEGRVISQSPKAGTFLPPGSTVRLVVSRGPAPVQVPDVEGKKLEDALRILSSAGLKASVSRLGPGNRVVYQLPPPGTTVRRGSTVQLWVG